MSENNEKMTPAEETTEPKVNETACEEILEQDVAEGETLLEVEDIDENTNPEKDMTTGAKIKVLLMNPLWSSIIKWVCVFLGIAGLVLFLIATSSRSTGEDFAKAFSGVSGSIAAFFGMIPVSMFEIIICATALGIIAYLVFIIIKTVKTKGKFHIAGLWVQFVYSLLAIAGVFALMCSLCYGIFTYRQQLSNTTGYKNAKTTSLDLSETMLYLIDRLNNTLADGEGNIFYKANGLSKYSANEKSSIAEITKKVNEAFENASADMPTLKGKKLNSKELVFKPLYTKMQVSSIYSPFTGELCINTEYPEVLIPMQVAKTMAMQRGYTDDGDAEFIAFLVCAEYSDDYYIQYSGYFNAYLILSSKLYRTNGKNLHLYLANTLRDDIKREYVQVVKEIDRLYGISSELSFTPAANKMSASDYCDVAKLLLFEFRDGVDNGTIAVDNTEEKSYGKYCNYLVQYYISDSDFQDQVVSTYVKFHPGAVAN